MLGATASVSCSSNQRHPCWPAPATYYAAPRRLFDKMKRDPGVEAQLLRLTQGALWEVLSRGGGSGVLDSIEMVVQQALCQGAEAAARGHGGARQADATLQAEQRRQQREATA